MTNLEIGMLLMTPMVWLGIIYIWATVLVVIFKTKEVSQQEAKTVGYVAIIIILTIWGLYFMFK